MMDEALPGCMGKKKYDTRSAVIRAVFLTSRLGFTGRLTVYRCPFCRGYHMGNVWLKERSSKTKHHTNEKETTMEKSLRNVAMNSITAQKSGLDRAPLVNTPRAHAFDEHLINSGISGNPFVEKDGRSVVAETLPKSSSM